MKIVILGADADTLPLAQAALARGHQIITLAEVPPRYAEPLRALCREAHRVDAWDALLDADLGDALIVASGPDEEQRAAQLRMLIQADVPVLVAHPIHRSLLVYYELDMIRQSTESVIVPYVPAAWHPATALLSPVGGRVAEALGGIEQVAIERPVAAGDRRTVVEALTRDAVLWRAVGVGGARIAAMGASGDSYGQLGVQVTGESESDTTVAVGRWNAVLHAPSLTACLTAIGPRGKAICRMPVAAATGDSKAPAPQSVEPWTLEVELSGERVTEVFDCWDAADEAIRRLEQAIASKQPKPAWLDVARDMDLVDAVARSLERGRMIHMQYDEPSEKATFKAVMSAGGCALMIIVPLVLIVMSMIDRLRLPLFNIWPYVILSIALLFLGLQLLQFVFPPKGRE